MPADPHPRYIVLDQHTTTMDGSYAGRTLTILDTWYCYEPVWRLRSRTTLATWKVRERARRALARLNAEHDAWLAEGAA
jgi:hypothetical protein